MPSVGDLEVDASPVKLFTYKKPTEMFESGAMVKLCAPMVRYTKLQFRELIRKYACDVTYTPMIMADSFTQSARARQVEFATKETDRPLVVQFAAHTADEFATAAQFVRHCADGVELNCGCPQRWAIQEGVGAALVERNELVCEMVREARRRLQYDKEFTVAIKIRLHTDIRRTVDLVRMASAALKGVLF
jgi:tRNA-dihydrouridine synthase 4